MAVADEGVRVERQFHDWDGVDGDELTDEALSPSRSTRYHATPSFGRTDIENLDAVTSALDDQLDRR